MKNRLVGALALLAILGPVAWYSLQIPGLRVTASSEALLLESDPALNLYNQTRADFGTDEYVIIAATVEDPLSDPTLDMLEDLEKQVLACPQVARALSILRVPLLSSGGTGGFGLQPTYISNGDAPEADLDLARIELKGHELYEGLLVSKDWKIVSMFVYLQVSKELDDLYLQRWRARRAIEEAKEHSVEIDAAAVAALQKQYDDLEARYRPLHAELEQSRRDLIYKLRDIIAAVSAKHHVPVTMAGVPVINVNMADYVRHDLKVFGVVSLVLAFVTLALLLGGLGRALVVLVSAAVPVLVTLGLMVTFDVPMSVVTCNLPSLLFVLSLEHGIHLVERWRRLAGQSDAPSDFRTLLGSLLFPCVMTATTTMAGFLSLIVTDLRPVIDFGIFMSIGVGLSVVASFWIVPAGLLLLPLPRQAPVAAAEPAANAAPSGLINWSLGATARFTLGHRRLVIFTSLVLLAVALLGARKLTAETRFSDYFKRSSEIVVGLEYIDQNLVGVTTMEVVVTAPEGETLLSGWGVDLIARIEDAARKLPSVTRIESIASIYREFSKTEFIKALQMPADQLLPMAMQFEDARKVALGYVTEDGRKSVIKVRLRETDPGLDRKAVRRQLETALAADPALKEVDPRFTGIFVLHGNLLDSLIPSQARSFGYVNVAIFLMFLVIFRSFSASLAGLVPNALPVMLVLGLMGYAAIALDLVTVMVASVAMGIGVDAAIHYIYAYRERVQAGEARDEAILHTHQTVGRPILFAAVTVVAAFGVLVLSEFIPSIYFGLFTALTMIAALAGTLTLIPALLSRRSGS